MVLRSPLITVGFKHATTLCWCASNLNGALKILWPFSKINLIGIKHAQSIQGFVPVLIGLSLVDGGVGSQGLVDVCKLARTPSVVEKMVQLVSGQYTIFGICACVVFSPFSFSSMFTKRGCSHLSISISKGNLNTI